MKPRVKMHQMPGDVGKCSKIAMLEGRHPDKRRSKSFRKLLKMRERATLNRRAEKEIEEHMKGKS